MGNNKWENSHHQEFTIKYNGEAVESHEIDANVLAKSMLGLSGALEHANNVVYGLDSKTFVKVKGSFKASSFSIDIVTLMSYTGIQNTFNVVEMVGFLGSSLGSLIWLYKKTKGEAIKSKKHIGDNNVILSFENCTDIVVNSHVADMYDTNKVKKELSDLTLPLENEKMSDITFLKDDVEIEKINRDEREYFHLDDNTDETLVTESIDYFLITQPNFDGKPGWRLTFADSLDSAYSKKDFAVKILDNLFLKEVNNKQITISNKIPIIIKAKYRKTIQKMERIVTSWEILEVLDYTYTTDEYKKINKHLDDYF